MHETLADAVRALQAEADVQQTLKRAIDLATTLIDDCDFAGVARVHRDGTIETAAGNNPVVVRSDELQSELSEGPSLLAMWNEATVYSPDVETDRRWPTWGRQAADTLGIRSMLCYQLFTSNTSLGVLSLFSQHPGAFDRDERTAGEVFSAHVAATIADANDQEHLHSAISRRTTIGQAEGILMERYDLTAGQAFQVLKRVSQARQVKLHDIADELVRTRRTPGV